MAIDQQESQDGTLSTIDQVRMLRKLMLYWDGQWFLKAAEAFGLEAAIDLNARVRASFGRIEMRILLRALGRPRARDLAEAMHMLRIYVSAFMGEALRAEFAAVEPQHAEVIIIRCAAFEGAKRAALSRVDQACVACETVWQAWLETLLPGARIDVCYPARMGKGDPRCRFVIQADLEAPPA